MSKDVFAASIGGRRMRMIGLLAVAVLRRGPGAAARRRGRRPRAGATGTTAARTSCSSSPPTACARTRSRSTPTRASCPASATCCATARKASGNGLLTQAPPNTGAGWFTLATGAWPGVARLDQQHVPRQRRSRSRNRTSGARLDRRAPGRDARPGGRARRQEGRPDRVGRRPQRHDRRARRSTSATSAPAAAWPRTTSRRPTTRRSPPSFGLQFDHPAGFAGQRAVPAGRAVADATGWTDVPPSYSPAQEMRLRVLDG